MEHLAGWSIVAAAGLLVLALAGPAPSDRCGSRHAPPSDRRRSGRDRAFTALPEQPPSPVKSPG